MNKKSVIVPEVSGLLENPNPFRSTSFKCPICSVLMVAVDGNQIDPKDGITVFCNNEHGAGEGQCSAQEVFGHGKHEKDAYEIVKDKYKKS
jgi:hypothetical protein